MNICDTETQIIVALFHPKILRSIDRVSVCGNLLNQIGHTKTQKRVNFACSIPVKEFGESLRLQVSQWLRKKRMHVIFSNFGIIKGGEVDALGTDLLLVHEPSCRRTGNSDKIFTVCTIVHSSAISKKAILHAHAHAEQIQDIMCMTYNIRCRSVVLLCAPNGKVSESWL